MNLWHSILITWIDYECVFGSRAWQPCEPCSREATFVWLWGLKATSVYPEEGGSMHFTWPRLAHGLKVTRMWHCSTWDVKGQCKRRWSVRPSFTEEVKRDKDIGKEKVSWEDKRPPLGIRGASIYWKSSTYLHPVFIYRLRWRPWSSSHD